MVNIFLRLAADIWATAILMVTITSQVHPFLLKGAESALRLQSDSFCFQLFAKLFLHTLDPFNIFQQQDFEIATNIVHLLGQIPKQTITTLKWSPPIADCSDNDMFQARKDPNIC